MALTVTCLRCDTQQMQVCMLHVADAVAVQVQRATAIYVRNMWCHQPICVGSSAWERCSVDQIVQPEHGVSLCLDFCFVCNGPANAGLLVLRRSPATQSRQSSGLPELQTTCMAKLNT